MGMSLSEARLAKERLEASLKQGLPLSEFLAAHSEIRDLRGTIRRLRAEERATR